MDMCQDVCIIHYNWFYLNYITCIILLSTVLSVYNLNCHHIESEIFYVMTKHSDFSPTAYYWLVLLTIAEGENKVCGCSNELYFSLTLFNGVTGEKKTIFLKWQLINVCTFTVGCYLITIWSGVPMACWQIGNGETYKKDKIDMIKEQEKHFSDRWNEGKLCNIFGKRFQYEGYRFVFDANNCISMCIYNRDQRNQYQL